MKKTLLSLLAVFMFSGSIFAQEVSVGAGVVSNYVWRGVKFAGPSIQPSIELGFGNLAIGSWGSFAITDDAPMENDFYISYSAGDLSIGLSDYYYQGPLFDFSDSTGSHAFDLNLGYTIGDITIAANYILNEAGGVAALGSDMYFEISYSLEKFNIFVGAGDGWHSSDTEFALVNIGINAEKEVKITEHFSLPIFGSVVINPDAEVAYVFAGFSF